MLRLMLRIALSVIVSGILSGYEGRPPQSAWAQGSQSYRLVLPSVLRHSMGGIAGAFIINHTTADLDSVPTQYIELAKNQLRLSYGHTSHGSQLISGADYWFDVNALLAFNTNGAIQADVLSIADYTPSGDLGNPDRTTWEARTRAYLNGAGANRNVVLWSWCGQVSSASAADIDTYLDLMSGLERDYPSIRFVYMTGHLDGSGPSGNLGVAQRPDPGLCSGQRQDPVRLRRHRELRPERRVLRQRRRQLPVVHDLVRGASRPVHGPAVVRALAWLQLQGEG